MTTRRMRLYADLVTQELQIFHDFFKSDTSAEDKTL